MQDAVLDLLQSLFVVRGGHDELLPLRLEVGPFLRDHHPQELVGQPVRRDHEVEQRNLHRRLREVVRVSQRRGDVEPELIGKLDDRVPELDAHHAAAFE